ncbi:hypothetical protein TSUD_317820 [Trifolium subterraneum]|uniref:Uncharacterized protein n=1 Tax=Trifolium subterraneum TaxID=3900 RepID=A0A2Z6M2I5_TRISU|nr:hypothetical protein TSUD_317820 [Trifolium subterraneum]
MGKEHWKGALDFDIRAFTNDAHQCRDGVAVRRHYKLNIFFEKLCAKADPRLREVTVELGLYKSGTYNEGRWALVQAETFVLDSSI